MLKGWKRMILSTTFKFVLLENEDDQHFKLLSLRQEMGANYAGMRLSALQTILDVDGFRTRKEQNGAGKLSSDKIAKLYLDNVHFAETATERPSSNDFIDKAITISNRMLSIPEVKRMLLDADAKYGLKHPLDSVTKLHAVVAA